MAGREGRERLARLEEAEALEHLLDGAVARDHGQDSSAAAAAAPPDVPAVAEACVTGSADGFTYAIANSERTQLERGLELLKRAPAPSFPQAGMQGLDQLPPDVRAKIEAQLRQEQLC